MEFWDSKLSGKKKFALDSRVLYFKQLDDDVFFTFIFKIGYIEISVVQIGEDVFDVKIGGRRFKDLMKQEKKNILQKKEREKRIQFEKKKKEEEYYNRALKYNGKDYYEGKEKNLLNNNNDNKNFKYDYNYYKQNKNDKYSNYNNYNNNNYNNNNIYNNNNYYNTYNNNNNYNYNAKINQLLDNNNNQKNINNNYDNNRYNHYKNDKYNSYDNKKNKNVYPSFNMYYNNTEINTGYNNNFNNNYKNNYNKKDNYLVDELTEKFGKQKIKKSSQMRDDLPTYSQLNYSNKVKNNNKELINYKGSLNNNKHIGSTKELTAAPLNNVKIKSDRENTPIKEDYNSDFRDNVNNEASQIQLNIYNNNVNLENIKKVYVNNSTLKVPKNQDYDDEENPYKNY